MNRLYFTQTKGWECYHKQRRLSCFMGIGFVDSSLDCQRPIQTQRQRIGNPPTICPRLNDTSDCRKNVAFA